MRIEDLMDKTLRDVLENYCTVYNLECGYYYGVFEYDDIDKIFEEYNIKEDYPEAFEVEGLISDEIIVSFDEDIKGYDSLLGIMKNLDISKKG